VSNRVDTAVVDFLFERIGDDSLQNWQLDLPVEEFGAILTGFPNGVPAVVSSESEEREDGPVKREGCQVGVEALVFALAGLYGLSLREDPSKSARQSS
jgi:hypothetical protein